MIRVWFNHWFSTSYRLMELMKTDAKEEICMIGSNLQMDSVIQKVCDEWYQESANEGEAYIEDCLTFCREKEIDVFVPRRHMVEVSKHRQRFEQMGVKVLVDDYEVIKLLNDKVAAYQFFKDCEELHIPEYCLVNTVDEFQKAYETLSKTYEKICIKFVCDEGGMSFRKIVEHSDRMTQLRRYQGADISYLDLVASLSEVERFDDLMVMPYLPGNEISVDCLMTSTGLIAVPRNKGNARHEKVEYDEQILRMVDVVMKKTGLHCPCNIQFKCKDDIPYLLEINTRMSGGLQMSCLAADVNIPNIALHELLGKPITWNMNCEEKTVSYIEIPQIIK